MASWPWRSGPLAAGTAAAGVSQLGAARSGATDGQPMDLTYELDPFVLDFLLDRGWLTGRELCRVAQVAKIFGGDAYQEDGLTACRVVHAARRRLADWLGLRPTSTESHLGLLVLVERSLELAPAEVPRGVVLYLWTQEDRGGAAPDADHVTAPPALPLRPAEEEDASAEAAEAEPEAADADAVAARTTDAVLLAGAQLIQSAADGTTTEGHPGAGGRVLLPGEADSAEVATVGQALEACLSAMERVQTATSSSSTPQLFEARLTLTANFLRDVGLHALGETALKRLPGIRRFLQASRPPATDASATQRFFSWVSSLATPRDEEAEAPPAEQMQAGDVRDDVTPEQRERDATQLVVSLSALSSSMVARFYAQTYVQAGDTESGEALALADAAVQICRERLLGAEALLVRAQTKPAQRTPHGWTLIRDCACTCARLRRRKRCTIMASPRRLAPKSRASA
jgi:hypothetical protein